MIWIQGFSAAYKSPLSIGHEEFLSHEHPNIHVQLGFRKPYLPLARLINLAAMLTSHRKLTF